jgi:hypothetical protein
VKARLDSNLSREQFNRLIRLAASTLSQELPVSVKHWEQLESNLLKESLEPLCVIDAPVPTPTGTVI